MGYMWRYKRNVYSHYHLLLINQRWCIIYNNMKKYKNIYISFVLYAIALLIALLAPKSLTPNLLSHLGLALVVILVLVGIFYGFKSIKTKESSWTGHLMVILGGLILASPLILFVLGANGFFN